MIRARWAAAIVAGLLGAVAAGAAEQIRIDHDFPGGNVIVDGIEGDVVRLRPDLRDTAGWWFYWYFRVQGAAGRQLRFEFTDGAPIGVRGPAISEDGGKSWRWLGAASGDSRSFSYRFPAEAGECRFAYTIPYLQADWEQFLAAHQQDPRVRPDVLCQSRGGRAVECLYLGPPDRQPQQRVLLTARHHACESMASFALEGLLHTVLTDRSEPIRWLAENTEFLAIPFVDKDGVENGDQGKNRRPRDHNRDYAGESLYPETAALRKLVPQWSGERLRVALDLHCPWIRGTRNEEIYIVGAEDESIWQQQQRFGELLEKVAEGPLPYRAADNLPFGVAWNQSSNYQQGMSCGRWAGSLPGIRLAASFELPYANARGAEVNASTARAFGRDLARALADYLRGPQE